LPAGLRVVLRPGCCPEHSLRSRISSLPATLRFSKSS
jgi:hypothetical protein